MTDLPEQHDEPTTDETPAEPATTSEHDQPTTEETPAEAAPTSEHDVPTSDETPAEAAPTSEQPPTTPPPTTPSPASPPPSTPPPAAWPQQQAQADSDRRNWAVGAHLSALVASVFTGLAVLGPLVVYLIKKDHDRFIAEHAREALNFQLTWLVGGFAATVAAIIITVVTVGLGLIVFVPAAIAFAIAWLVFMVKASMAASRGEYYRYPLTVRLVS